MGLDAANNAAPLIYNVRFINGIEGSCFFNFNCHVHNMFNNVAHSYLSWVSGNDEHKR